MEGGKLLARTIGVMKLHRFQYLEVLVMLPWSPLLDGLFGKGRVIQHNLHGPLPI